MTRIQVQSIGALAHSSLHATGTSCQALLHLYIFELATSLRMLGEQTDGPDQDYVLSRIDLETAAYLRLDSA